MSASDAGNGGGTTRLPAIERFAAKCSFDAITGCVNWTGGTGSSRGGREKVGRFWDEGKMWNAHQWAAKHIHGIDIKTHTVYRTCRNPLCVEHIGASEGQQSSAERQMWLLIDRGYEEPEPRPEEDTDAIPFALTPDWLRPYLKRQETDDAPF